jgi:hypothetical protein
LESDAPAVNVKLFSLTVFVPQASALRAAEQHRAISISSALSCQ